MKELKLEVEARNRVGDTKIANSQRGPRDTVEVLLSVDKINSTFCQQDHFADRCNIVTNANTRKTCYIVSWDDTSVQREGITKEIVKAREHVFDAKDDIKQTSVKEQRDKDNSRQQTNNDKSNDSKKSNDNKDSDNEQTQPQNTSRTATNTVTPNNKVVLIQTATVVVNSKRDNSKRVMQITFW